MLLMNELQRNTGGKMRTVEEVIKKIIDISPNADLNHALGKIAFNASFKAPEAMGLAWGELANTLEHYLPWPPNDEISWQIVAIVQNCTVEEAKIKFHCI